MESRIVVIDEKRPHLGGNIRGGDQDTYCPQVWDFLIDRFAPKSIMDIGCGEGYLMEYFASKGIEVFGIDGLQANKDNAPESIRERIEIHDYTTGYSNAENVDMVISCEFVEHVEPRYMHNYLLQFFNCKTLVFTHALPGQPGHHHVNCMSDDNWIELMAIFKWKLSLLTCQARKVVNKVLWETVLIFEKDE